MVVSPANSSARANAKLGKIRAWSEELIGENFERDAEPLSGEQKGSAKLIIEKIRETAEPG